MADIVADYLGWRHPTREAELIHERGEMNKAAEQTKVAAGQLVHTVRNIEQKQRAYIRLMSQSFDEVEDRLRRRR